MDLPEIPPIPQEILDAINANSFAIFIGAGVSRLVGCIGWDALALNLLNICAEVEEGDALINFKEKKALGNIIDHRKIITICYKLLSKSNKLSRFKSEMRKAPLVNKRIARPNIYDNLAKIKSLKITTNADKLFDFNFSDINIKYLENDFDIETEPLSEDKLYHIHGSIRKFDTLVFTLPQYFKRYSSPYYRNFLMEVFSKKVILFIGYGLTEFELLEFLFLRNNDSNKERKHLLLQGFFNGEDNLIDMDKMYYADMGIKLITYALDRNGYHQLNSIIEFWANEIDRKTIKLSENLRLMKDAVR